MAFFLILIYRILKSHIMKKRIKSTILTCLILITVTNQSFGQCYDNSEYEVTINHNKYILAGDLIYTNDIVGIKSYMNDIENYNTDLYYKLLPKYQILEKKQKTAIVLWISSGIIALISAINTSGNSTFSLDYTSVPKNNNSFIGFGLAMGTGALGVLIYPNKQDIYNFINYHNMNNPDMKMEIKTADINNKTTFQFFTLAYNF